MIKNVLILSVSLIIQNITGFMCPDFHEYRTNWPCQGAANPISKQNEKSCVHVLYVNREAVSNKDIPNIHYTYNVGEKLNFTCGVTCTSDDYKYEYRLVHQRNEYNVTIPPTDVEKPKSNPTKFIYIITANEFDNGSKIFCSSKKETNILRKYFLRTVITLFMNSDTTLNNSIKEIQFHNDTVINNICTKNKRTSNQKLIKEENGMLYTYSAIEDMVTPSHSGAVYFCEYFSIKLLRDGVGRKFIRINDNMAKYLYVPSNENEALSSPVKITIGVGVVVSIVLVASFLLLLYKNKKKKPAEDTSTNQDTELYDSPNPVIYANLDLSETADSDTDSPDREDSTNNYVQIACPNQVIYADLDLTETADSDTVSPDREDSTNYVQIAYTNPVIYADLELSETSNSAIISPDREYSNNYVQIAGIVTKNKKK